MEIKVDPSNMSQAQREAVAAFILAYPANDVNAEIKANSLKLLNDVLPVGYAAASEPVRHLNDEIAHLAKEGGEFDASVTFGDPAPIAAFGLPMPGPSAHDLGHPLSATEAVAATFGQANLPKVGAVPQTTSLEGQLVLDKTGLQWDARIHAESKAKIADGTWRKKRNLDPALASTVEAELRQVMGAPLAVVALIPAPPAATVTIPTDGPASLVVTVPAPPASPLSQVAPLPPSPSAPPVASVPQDARAQFVGLVGRASAAIQAGKVTQADITQCCADAGVPALPLLANRLDLVAQVAAQVDALIASR